MADKVKEVAKEEADRIKSLAVEAARSAAYLYPLRVCSSHDCSETILFRRRSLYSLVEQPLTLLLLGYCIFSITPRPMASNDLQARAHCLPRPGRHDLHVCLYVLAASCRYVLSRRSS